ncbi:MAG: type II toxin-antitoxin system mRNA interferase toxin, RelE/StbE family [Gammaproteobacteria bacterium]|nr:type II toxin-antitoxin system mRNA interferase toxin, RelE/StbE family [Gammaproteobacteria bacterium]
MTWIIEFDPQVEKDLKKLSQKDKHRIFDFLENRLSHFESPRQSGKPLKGKKLEIWRYRVGNHRLLCEIQDNVLRILVLKIGHRKEIYR